jgi:endoglucanase
MVASRKSQPPWTQLRRYSYLNPATEQDTYWGGDLSIPSPRTVYTIDNNHPGTDAAAGAAAAFAACSNLYASRAFDSGSFNAPASLKNDSYAGKLLIHAEQLYTLAVNATAGRKVYQNSVPQVTSAYASSGYGDELAIAALFLSYATGSSTFYQDAEDAYSKYNLADSDAVFNWDSKTPGLAVLFSQVLQVNPHLGGNYSIWRQQAENYFDNLIDNAYFTDGQYYSFPFS